MIIKELYINKKIKNITTSSYVNFFIPNFHYKYYYKNKKYKNNKIYKNILNKRNKLRKYYNFYLPKFISYYKEINFKIKHITLISSIMQDTIIKTRLMWLQNSPKFFINFIIKNHN